MREKASTIRWLLLLLVPLFLFVACDSDEGEPEAENLDEPPEVYLLVDGEPLAGVQAHTCWPEQEGGTVDLSEYDELVDICGQDANLDFDPADFFALPLSEPIRVQMEEPLPDRLALRLTPPDNSGLVQRDVEIFFDDATMSWEPENVGPGDYLLVAMGYWPDVGGASYYFPVTLEE